MLGQKDSFGRLQLGSILRLVIDDKTDTPVLHVDAPFGTSNVFYDDEYMFDKILEVSYDKTKVFVVTQLSHSSFLIICTIT